MPILEDMSAALKDALKSRDKITIGTLRLVLAAVKDRAIAARSEGKSDELSDAELVELLGKMIRQRRDSAQSYAEAKRDDLAQQEQAEIAVIEKFLPPQMEESDIIEAVKKAIEQCQATNLKDMGQVMQALKQEYQGQMDFARASCMVKKSLV